MTIHQIATLAVCLLLASAAAAFHDGGVAECRVCHVMHESEDGSLVPAGDHLLREASATDLCLSCHAEQVFGNDPLAPPPEVGAGNFAFLLEDELNDEVGSSIMIPGAHAGHSLVVPSLGLGPDPDYVTAPGGTFPSNRLGCTSCHDPHGNGNFRMLNGAGPVQDGLFTFLYPAPDAEGLPVSPAIFAETPTSHTAYRGGMSDWCANCHGLYHDVVGRATIVHPYEAVPGSDTLLRYDLYDGEADPTGGSHATAYLPQVPFEDPAASTTSQTGPGAGAVVACTTCHRAHASSAPAATRWDMRVAQLGSDGVASGSYALPNPYGDPQQRQLCLKCHELDHAYGSPLSCTRCHRRQYRR